MTAMDQDFEMIAGDNFAPIFTVKDSAGNPIDISGVTEIVWTAQADLSTAAAITKRKTTAGIVLVGGGTTGQFQPLLVPTDTQSLSGYFLHKAVITDSSGDISTVSLGRMQVGPGPAWTYSGDPRNSDKDAVRYLVGDTEASKPLVNDAEILFAISQRTSTYGAAAIICASLAAKFSREADTGDRDMRTNLSQRAASFRAMAKDYEAKAEAKFTATNIAGLLRPFA